MSISSIAGNAASAVLQPPEASETKPPVVIPAETDSSRASKPPVLAALPPGQGTRINQLA